MADKPKTYAQQVQELKEEREQLLTTIADLERQTSFIPELQDKISELNAQLAAHADRDRNSMVNDKAQLTDTIQRAESAEQGLRNAQSHIAALQNLKEQLENQLNVMAVEADKTIGKDKKITALEEEIKRGNLKVATIQQQYRDLQLQFNESVAGLEKETMYLRELTRAQAARLAEVTAAVQSMPDIISALKGMISRW
jgi:chromosome segregation ATPase